MREFLITTNDSDQRVDKFVQKVTTGLPHSLLYKTFRKKDIKINGKKCAIHEMLKEGDYVRIYLSDEFFPQKEIQKNRNALPIEIVYEDENLLVANKPVGLLSHSNEAGEQDTAISRIQAYLIKNGSYRPEEENSFSPALISRLDRNTGGLIVAAKNASALRELSEMMRNHQVHKIYLALVEGKPLKSGEFIGQLEKDSDQNKVSIGMTGKPVHCRYKRLNTFENQNGPTSLMEVELLTGRSHQIRAQFSDAGFPLVGDVKYGGKKRSGHKGQFLFASQLSFSPPTDSLLYYLSTVQIEKRPAWAKEK